MSKFVESCVEMVKEPAKLAERAQKGKPRARKLLKAVDGKQNIVVTCHMHPDPDALGSAAALTYLLEQRLPDAKVRMCVRGQIPGGLNDAFTKHAKLEIDPWPESFDDIDATILCDVQPSFPTNPLPVGVSPMAVVDHHRSRRKNPDCKFCDIRPDIGATASIV
ncbi:MAG: DHH family phosphoesterase, partial [Planctomycetota bacterium]